MGNGEWLRGQTEHGMLAVRGKPVSLHGAGADEWVTQLLRQGDAEVFKKYSQMKLHMKREALAKLNRQANEWWFGFWSGRGDSNARPPAPKASAHTRLKAS